MSIDSVESAGSSSPSELHNQQDAALYAFSQSTPELDSLDGGDEVGPTNLRQRLKSIACFWNLSTDSNRTEVPELDFARLAAPMFNKRSASLQPSLGTIRSDLYRQKTTDSVDSNGSEISCGKLIFKLRFNVENQKLFVFIMRACDLPTKDCGTLQDVGVKCYMLPDKKKKFQTKVAKKTSNPEFNEEFSFNAKFAELSTRMLQFVVFSFDRFSRQKIIGLVFVSNLVEQFDYAWETECTRDIISTEQV